MGTTMADSSGVVGRALIWATAISFFVFFLFSAVFFGNLGPIPALIYGPTAFVVSFIVFWIVESLLERHTRSNRKKFYVVLCVILLAPIVIYTGYNYQESTRAERMEHAPPLTNEEELLLKSTRLNLRIGVDNPRYAWVDTRSLIEDLRETCLFLEVGEINGFFRADVFATITGRYKDKTGFKFIFHLPEQKREGIEIEVRYKLKSVWTRGVSRRTDRKQYIDRLAVELIKAFQSLSDRSELIAAEQSVVKTSDGISCRRDQLK
ncbi:MAG: hypothetical protein AMJ65_08000 [Phycisphaerae bacterium SG8_4]|jgi:hypothetical protein|nr:MAG: hypothetical protein AMJ65_08000 [Phycisphaerae bacterium SG8_4]